MRDKSPAAKLKAWQAVDRLLARWDAEGWPEYDPDELSEPPALSTLEDHDAKYTRHTPPPWSDIDDITTWQCIHK